MESNMTWVTFMETINAHQLAEDKLFSQRQKIVRKDVEKTFGVLHARFNIVHQPARLWKQEDFMNIMQACVILHNMIVEDEKEAVTDVLDLNKNPSATLVIPPNCVQMTTLIQAMQRHFVEIWLSKLGQHKGNSRRN
jgi:hypothetical protein